MSVAVRARPWPAFPSLTSRRRFPTDAAGRAHPPDSALTPVVDRSADDATLVSLAVAGNREAFDVIVERHRRMVYQVCYRFTRSHEDASDLAQDVFIRAYRALGTFEGKASLSTWLYRIAVNCSLNRTSTVRPEHDPIEDVPALAAPGESADAALVRGEEAARVRSAVARLPERQRATLILRVYHELPHEEIARVLGGSVGTAKANFFHALRNLRKLLVEGAER